MILFLDFDGVLHPQPYDDGDEFCLRPFFERFARDYPNLQIVISSSWRHDHANIDALRDYFSADIAEMIIGMTPDHLELSADFLPHLLEYERQREILFWCMQNGVLEDEWIALDDDAEIFAPDCTQLVLCDPEWGLTEYSLKTMRTLISQHPKQRLVP